MISKEQLQQKSPEELVSIIDGLQGHIKILEHRIDTLLRYRFASRTEKLKDNDRQLNLFDEAELPPIEEEAAVQTTEQTTIVKQHTRKKRGRKPLPKDLPRIREEHDLPEEEKYCPCGCQLEVIGEDISEQLEIIPAQMFVIEHAKKKYACKHCESTIKTAKLPPQPIPKSMAGPGLLSHILVSKFCDHLPLYRQENILQRCGIDISRATLCHWVIRCGQLIEPLVKLLQATIIEHDIAYSDETVVQVLKEKNRHAKQKSYMWLFGGGPLDKFCWVYQYHPSRSGEIASNFFSNFKGYLHTDGFSGYNELARQEVILVGCFAHARRKFFEVAQAANKKKGLAHFALNHIAKLYKIEKEAKQKELQAPEIYRLRQEKAKPLLDEFKTWLDEKSQKVPPKSPIGKAIQYSLNQWHKLVRYLEDGRCEIDNNRSERAIKPFVIGRKNWLFADRVAGADAAANIFSLIETCKANNIEPYAYLRYVLTQLPRATTPEEIEQLLPFNCNSKMLNTQWEMLTQRLKE